MNKQQEQQEQILKFIEELKKLVMTRHDLREVYAELGTAWQATGLAFYKKLMDSCAKAGIVLGLQIEDWHDRVQRLDMEEFLKWLNDYAEGEEEK